MHTRCSNTCLPYTQHNSMQYTRPMARPNTVPIPRPVTRPMPRAMPRPITTPNMRPRMISNAISNQTTVSHTSIAKPTDEELMKIAVQESIETEALRIKHNQELDDVLTESQTASISECADNVKNNYIKNDCNKMEDNFIQSIVSTVDSENKYNCIENSDNKKSFDDADNVAHVLRLSTRNSSLYRESRIFVVGRGRKELYGYMNIPMNPDIIKRGVIFIDNNEESAPDICKYLHDVDLDAYGMLSRQTNDIDFIIMFDWSSFYCNALEMLQHQMLNLSRRCTIIVPLAPDENIMPNEIKNKLTSKIFTLSITEGQYPMFDWSPQNIEKIKSIVNHNRYIEIRVYQRI